jgi:hypothetical protein
MCDWGKRGWGHTLYREYPAPLRFLLGYIRMDLGLADSKHFGATYRTCALGRRFAILHGDALSILNLPLGLALHTITLHVITLLTVFVLRLNHLTCLGQVGSYHFGDKKAKAPYIV